MNYSNFRATLNQMLTDKELGDAMMEIHRNHVSSGIDCHKEGRCLDARLASDHYNKFSSAFGLILNAYAEALEYREAVKA